MWKKGQKKNKERNLQKSTTIQIYPAASLELLMQLEKLVPLMLASHTANSWSLYFTSGETQLIENVISACEVSWLKSCPGIRIIKNYSALPLKSDFTPIKPIQFFSFNCEKDLALNYNTLIAKFTELAIPWKCKTAERKESS